MRSIFALLRRRSGWILLLLSGFLLPLLTGLLTSWLEKNFGSTRGQLLQLLAFVAGFIIVLWVVAGLLKRERVDWVLVSRDQRPPRFPGLVVLVGPPPIDPKTGQRRDPMGGPQAAAIEYHLGEVGETPVLKHCWLVTSREGVPVSEILQKNFEDRCQFVELRIENAFNVQETYASVRDIYSRAAEKIGLEPDQVIADFTGGTRTMTAGLVLVCQDLRPMQYMSQKGDSASTPLYVRFKHIADKVENA